jgi:hypothetical protein
MSTPNVNIVNGQVTGTLQKGGTFYWYNPTANETQSITISGFDSWCAGTSYVIYAGEQYSAAASILANPASPYSFSESPNRWNAPGMPRTQGPIHLPTPGNEDKEVA